MEDLLLIDEIDNESAGTLEKLYASLDDMASMHNEILQIGGVNKTTAISIEAICPGTLNVENYPLNSFTDAVSVTNYKIAVESVVAKIKDGYNAIIDLFVKIYRKVVEFISTLLGKISDRFKSNSQIDEKIEAEEKAIVYYLEHLPQTDKAKATTVLNKTTSELDVLLKDAIVKNNNELLHDIIKGGHVYLAYKTFGSEFVHYLKHVLERMNDFYNAAKIVAEDKPLENIDDLIAKKYSPSSAFLMHVKALTPIGGEAYNNSIPNLLRRLKYQAKALYENKDTEVPTYKDIIQSEAGNSAVQHIDKVLILVEDIDKKAKRGYIGSKRVDATNAANSKLIALGEMARLESVGVGAYMATVTLFSQIATDVSRLKLSATVAKKAAVKASALHQ